jgi:hypothetical protein
LNCAVLTDERGQNRIDTLLDFAVDQRAIGGLERQAHRQTDAALRHALALVAIEELTLASGAGVSRPAA